MKAQNGNDILNTIVGTKANIVGNALPVEIIEEWRSPAFIHSFIHDISIAPLQVHHYPEALPTQHGYCVGVSRRSATGNCE